jgi:D-alanyl-D-alanine carboxypeptidase/D-alanyl-D-alanine-endopeptidase (penicillin-binding protein 4)
MIAPKTAIAVLAALLVVATACSDDDDGSSDESSGAATTAEVGALPEAAREIMEQPEYANARWLYYVAEAESGDVLLSGRGDEMVFTGSTAKNFTVGTVYDTLGTDTRLTTPVYSTTPVADGVVGGDVVLVASGDLALGGRGGLDGDFEHTFYGDTIDHVYANIAPNARPASEVGDPLAGLDSLATQIADSGVTRIDGDVVIDTRIWEDYDTQDGTVTPIFVNDNLLDVTVTAAGAGEIATLEVSPATDAYTVVSEVETVGADGETQLAVDADPADPTRLIVSGTIVEDGSQLTIYRFDDPASWARTLFIEALTRAGITVAASPAAANDEAGLPAPDGYVADQELASIESPTIEAMGAMILETSYNTGANTFVCYLALELGSTDCETGLETIDALVAEAGLEVSAVFLVDGQGADPASTTARQMSEWLRWSRDQEWGDAFVAGQPVLGESGSLADKGLDRPATGKVAAKAGTSAALDPVTGRLYLKVQSLGGYMTLDDGTVLVFGLSMSGATFPTLLEGLVQSGEDVADVAAAFQEALSE